MPSAAAWRLLQTLSRGPFFFFFLRGVPLFSLLFLPFALLFAPCLALFLLLLLGALLAAVILGPVLALLLFAVLDGRLDHFFHIDVRRAVFLGGTLSEVNIHSTTGMLASRSTSLFKRRARSSEVASAFWKSTILELTVGS